MEKKKWSKGQKIALSIIFGLIVLIVIIVSIIPKVAAPKPKQLTWNEMNYEQQTTWIRDRIDNGQLPDDFYSTIMELIRKQFKFPEEVHFVDVPTRSAADITVADTGIVFFHGLITAKNAFGMKSRYAYSVRTIIRPDTVYIDTVSVSER